MKILMVLEWEFPPDVRVENEMLALTEAGHEVHLACSTRKEKLREDSHGKAIIHRKKISTFVYKSSVGCLKFPFYFSFWKKFVYKLFEKEKFDVIHIHDLPLSIIGTEIKNLYGIPLVIDLHENWPALIRTAVHTQTFAGRLLSSHKQWIDYERKMLLKADNIITIVKESKERIISLGVDKDKICLVSNTINPQNIPALSVNKKEESFTIFYGGAINKHRGLQIVFKAISKLTDKNIPVNLWIAGEGSYKKELEKLSKTLKINPYLRFFGYKPFDEMLKLLAVCDVAIIPHLRTENNDASSPNKLYQYMYLEKPVISSDCISLKRIVNETGAGYVYQNDSPDELALLIEKLVNDRWLIENTGKKGKKAVLEKYNWNNDKTRLIDLYRHLAAKDG
jgi:glycosyltransferase involved in cell wall biosynthesis